MLNLKSLLLKLTNIASRPYSGYDSLYTGSSMSNAANQYYLRTLSQNNIYSRSSYDLGIIGFSVKTLSGFTNDIVTWQEANRYNTYIKTNLLYVGPITSSRATLTDSTAINSGNKGYRQGFSISFTSSELSQLGFKTPYEGIASMASISHTGVVGVTSAIETSSTGATLIISFITYNADNVSNSTQIQLYLWQTY